MAAEMLDAMRCFRKEVNKIHLGVVINACQKETAWYQAVCALAKGEQTTISASSVISACRDSGHWTVALSLVRAMRSSRLQPSLISLNAAVSACEKTGLWRTACGVLQVLMSWRMQSDTVSFNAAASACEKAADWMAALNLLLEMYCSWIPRSNVTFGAVVSACEKAEQWNWATELLLSTRKEQLQPHLELCNGLLSALGKGKKWKASLGLVGHLPNYLLRPDTITFNSALYACDQEQWLASMSLLHCMTTCMTKRNDITFNAAAATLTGQWLSALQCLTEMSSVRLTADALTQSAIIHACTSAQRCEVSLNMLRHMADAWMSRVRVQKGGRSRLFSNSRGRPRLVDSILELQLLGQVLRQVETRGWHSMKWKAAGH